MRFSRDEFRNPDYSGRRGWLKWPLNMILGVVTLPVNALFQLFSWIFRQAGEWWKHRKLKNLLFGLPSLVVIGVCVYFLTGHVTNSRFVRAQSYLTQGEAALQKEQWETARLLLGRSAALHPERSETLLKLAQASEKTGDMAQVAAIMKQLAPEDSPGYPEAHLWRASDFLSRSPLSQEDVLAGESHLQRVLAARPNDIAANTILGELYFQSGSFDRAARHLERVADVNPRLNMMLAKSLSMKGDQTSAAFRARQAIGFWERELEQNSRDKSAILQLADCHFFLEQFPQAVKLLKQGLESEPDQQYEASFRRALSNVYVRWSDVDGGTSPEAFQQRFDKLATALAFNPNDFQVFDRINYLFLRDEETRKTGTQVLLSNITQGIAVAMSHLILGTMEPAGSEKSQFHLERAYEEIPTAGVIINNLAWSLAHTESPQLNRALELVDELIRKAGDTPDPRFLDTRGVILVKLSRWREAISDLETALPNHRNNKDTHLALALAYEGLGVEELARRHRELANRAENQK